MPAITQTTYDPRIRQQYNLQLMQGIGNLAGTLAGAYKDYKMMEARKQDLEDQKEFAFKRSMFEKALENKDWGEAARIGEDIYQGMGATEIINNYADAYEKNDTARANALRKIIMNSS